MNWDFKGNHLTTSLFLVLIVTLLLSVSADAGDDSGNAPAMNRMLLKSSCSEGSQPDSDAWLAQDKANHVLVSAMLAGSGLLSLKVTRNDEDVSFVSTIGITLGIGIMKEIYDYYHPGHRSSWRDLTADALGALLGALAVRNL